MVIGLSVEIVKSEGCGK